ncbi:MAG: YqiJ family protein [Armatimonadetes bacterium]|nr:YqiJ family protein [Armatimonadota bacterium]
MQINALGLVFTGLAAIGAFYTIASILMGGFTHVGHFGHGAGFHLHAGHSLAHTTGHTGSQNTHENLMGLSWLSPMTISAWLLGFGIFGLVGQSLHADAIGSVLCAVVGSMAMAVGSFLTVSRFFGQASISSDFQAEDAVGMNATTLTSIGHTQNGTIGCVVAGTRCTFIAIAEEEETIPPGTPVRIRRLRDGIAEVTRAL